MAFAPEGKPTEKRYEFIPVKLFAAGHTVRGYGNNALFFGDAVDADIKEATEHNAEQKCENINKPRRCFHYEFS